MNICMFSRIMPAHSLGGMQDHVQTLSAGLVAKGHRVVVLTTACADGLEFEIADGVEIYYLRDTVPGGSDVDSGGAAPFSEPTPDVVVAQEPAADSTGNRVSVLINRGEGSRTYVMPDLIGVNGDRAGAVPAAAVVFRKSRRFVDIRRSSGSVKKGESAHRRQAMRLLMGSLADCGRKRHRIRGKTGSRSTMKAAAAA